MKSRISIDVDEFSQPVIKIEYEHSPDVRDKLVKQFADAFGGESYLASFFYPSCEQTNKVMIIKPVRPIELGLHLEYLKGMASKYKEIESGEPYPSPYFTITSENKTE